MFCPKCGREVVKDAKFCLYCGQPVIQDDEYSEKIENLSEKKRNNNIKTAKAVEQEDQRWKKVLISLLVVVSVIVVFVYFYNGNNNRRENINKLLSQYGITRVFIYDDDVFEEILRSNERPITIEPFRLIQEGVFAKTWLHFSPYDTEGYPVAYIFHGSKEEEEKAIGEIYKIWRDTKNYKLKRELHYMIDWLIEQGRSTKFSGMTNHREWQGGGYDLSALSVELDYDDAGRNTGLSRYYSNNIIKTNYRINYNEMGNIEEINTSFFDSLSGNPVKEIEYDYQYDDNNMITEVLRIVAEYDRNEAYMVTDKDVTTYQYNEDGTIALMENNGKETIFNYDNNGKLISFGNEDGNEEPKYEYDINNNPVKYITETEGVLWEYDRNGNLTCLMHTNSSGQCTEKYLLDYDEDNYVVSITEMVYGDILFKADYDYGNLNLIECYNKSYTREGTEEKWKWEYEYESVNDILRIRTACLYLNDRLHDRMEYHYIEQ